MRLIKGHKYQCKAIEILNFGVVMEMSDGSTEFLHISNVADTFVKDINNYIQLGETYEVTAVPGKVKKMEITLKSTDVVPDTDEDYEKMDFGELLDMYPPTGNDLRNKHDRYKPKKRR